MSVTRTTKGFELLLGALEPPQTARAATPAKSTSIRAVLMSQSVRTSAQPANVLRVGGTHRSAPGHRDRRNGCLPPARGRSARDRARARRPAWLGPRARAALQAA